MCHSSTANYCATNFKRATRLCPLTTQPLRGTKPYRLYNRCSVGNCICHLCTYCIWNGKYWPFAFSTDRIYLRVCGGGAGVNISINLLEVGGVLVTPDQSVAGIQSGYTDASANLSNCFVPSMGCYTFGSNVRLKWNDYYTEIIP